MFELENSDERVDWPERTVFRAFAPVEPGYTARRRRDSRRHSSMRSYTIDLPV
jgi:hypothetical protein